MNQMDRGSQNNLVDFSNESRAGSESALDQNNAADSTAKDFSNLKISNETPFSNGTNPFDTFLQGNSTSLSFFDVDPFEKQFESLSRKSTPSTPMSCKKQISPSTPTIPTLPPPPSSAGRTSRHRPTSQSSQSHNKTSQSSNCSTLTRRSVNVSLVSADDVSSGSSQLPSVPPKQLDLFSVLAGDSSKLLGQSALDDNKFSSNEPSPEDFLLDCFSKPVDEEPSQHKSSNEMKLETKEDAESKLNTLLKDNDESFYTLPEFESKLKSFPTVTKTSWSMEMRFPMDKNIMSNRRWVPIFVRLLNMEVTLCLLL